MCVPDDAYKMYKRAVWKSSEQYGTKQLIIFNLESTKSKDTKNTPVH